MCTPLSVNTCRLAQQPPQYEKSQHPNPTPQKYLCMPSISPHITCKHCPAVHHRLHRPPRNLTTNPPTSNPQNPGFNDGVRKEFVGFARVIGLPRTCPVPGRTVLAYGANRHGRTRFVSVLTRRNTPSSVNASNRSSALDHGRNISVHDIICRGPGRHECPSHVHARFPRVRGL